MFEKRSFSIEQIKVTSNFASIHKYKKNKVELPRAQDIGTQFVKQGWQHTILGKI